MPNGWTERTARRYLDAVGGVKALPAARLVGVPTVIRPTESFLLGYVATQSSSTVSALFGAFLAVGLIQGCLYSPVHRVFLVIEAACVPL